MNMKSLTSTSTSVTIETTGYLKINEDVIVTSCNSFSYKGTDITMNSLTISQSIFTLTTTGSMIISNDLIITNTPFTYEGTLIKAEGVSVTSSTIELSEITSVEVANTLSIENKSKFVNKGQSTLSSYVKVTDVHFFDLCYWKFIDAIFSIFGRW